LPPPSDTERRGQVMAWLFWQMVSCGGKPMPHVGMRLACGWRRGAPFRRAG
jgi:hypothetical protein